MSKPSSARQIAFIVVAMALGGLIAYFWLFRGQPSDRAVPVLGSVPDFVLTDQDGKSLGMQDLLGKTWVASFIFTRCGATCPAQAKNAGILQDKLKSASLTDKTRLVFFSVDPEHDTPKVLSDYANAHGATRGLWYFLTGPVDNIVSLSQQGFKLAAARPQSAEGKGVPQHSSQLALVDGWGQIRGYYDGVSNEAVNELFRDLKTVMAEKAPSVPPASETAASRDPSQYLSPAVKEVSWLKMRQREQLDQAKTWTVFHDFQFNDRLYESGITFLNRIVDDAASIYKAVHYDHGTGIAVADVDGDGRHDVFFVNQVGGSQLWRNLGGGKFEDITAKAGVGLPDPIKVTATFVDVNNDGFIDLYVTTVRGGNHLYLNDGQGKFRDISENSGLGLVGHYSAPVFFDFDRDGLVDLFLCDVGKYSTDNLRTVTTPTYGTTTQDQKQYKYYEGFTDAFAGHLKPERSGKCLLMRNTGNGRFVDVTKDMGLDDHKGWTGDATPIDVNGDQWPDLYVLNMQGSNSYYENEGGKRFVRKTPGVFAKTPWGAMGVKVFDYNNDGKLDLLVTDMHSDMSAGVNPTLAEEKRKSRVTWSEAFLNTKGASLFGNALYENQRPGEYKEVSDAIGVENYWPWGLSVADLNADGFQDVFITAGMSHPFRYGINSLLLNDAGKRFLDSEFVLGVEPRRGGRTAMPWYEATPGSALPGQAPGSKPLTTPVTVWSSLSSRSSVLFDLDDDGDLDIVTNEFNTAPLVLINNLNERKKIRYLTVRLIGSMTADSKPSLAGTDQSRSNRDALGARVRVRCGDKNYWQIHDGKSGYLSQSILPLYFGIGEATKVDEIEVFWPSGKKTTIGATEANKLVTIREQ